MKSLAEFVNQLFFLETEKTVVQRPIMKGKYICLTCGKDFADNYKLTRHMATHTGAKPYPCDQCEKEFSRKEHLSRHMRIHTGEKPYECMVCYKAFVRKDKLNYHLAAHKATY